MDIRMAGVTGELTILKGSVTDLAGYVGCILVSRVSGSLTYVCGSRRQSKEDRLRLFF